MTILAPSLWPISPDRRRYVEERELAKRAWLANKRLAGTLTELSRRSQGASLSPPPETETDPFAETDLFGSETDPEGETDPPGAGERPAPRDSKAQERYRDLESALYRAGLLEGLHDNDLDVIEALLDRFARGELSTSDWRKLVNDLRSRRTGLDLLPVSGFRRPWQTSKR